MDASKLKAGTLVAFYRKGWHYGYFVKLEKKRAVIQPLRYGSKPRLVRIDIQDVKGETSK